MKLERELGEITKTLENIRDTVGEVKGQLQKKCEEQHNLTLELDRIKRSLELHLENHTEAKQSQKYSKLVLYRNITIIIAVLSLLVNILVRLWM